MATVKTEQEITIMREGGAILAGVLAEVQKRVAPGVTTAELNEFAEEHIASHDAEPAFKGYQGFPAVLCTSVNADIVHGVPDDRPLQDGDIISLDCGVRWKGFFTDMAVTVPVGDVGSGEHRLIRVVRKALKRGIKKARAGNTVGDIGNTIERYLTDQDVGIVRELCGHGIGREIHEPPQVFNVGRRGEGEVLEEGMTICIEPMITAGSPALTRTADGHGFTTEDGSLSAHYEHTLLVRASGGEILTAVPE